MPRRVAGGPVRWRCFSPTDKLSSMRGARVHIRRTLIMITGEEGVGKSTVMSALLLRTPGAAKIDAEDVGQVNPFNFSQSFLDLLWDNIAGVITNFWGAGYSVVITGSLLNGDTHASLQQFRTRLSDDFDLYLVHLTASKKVRDQRRISRAKPSTKDWRDRVDASYPTGDTSLSDNAADYRYIGVDNDDQQLIETLEVIMEAIPAVYRAGPASAR